MEMILFKYPGCPYCRNAEKAIEELVAEHPEYGEIEIRRVDETAEADVAAKYDYYYTPCFFMDGTKLYEARPFDTYNKMKSKIEAMFRSVLEK
jgi:glutaredoxin